MPNARPHPCLVQDLNPAKGIGPNLLRPLNNLLRRISKTGSTMQFCGRILIFLSSVFPFGERSGVNLRGEYGPEWTPVETLVPTSEAMEGVESTGASPSSPPSSSQAGASSSDAAKKKAEFYNIFWSLQTYFARPQTFANKDAFPAFKKSVEAVLAVLIEATKKEQAMMGSGGKGQASSGSKRKFADTQDMAEDTTTGQKYFFAKYLTSPDLLEFEVSSIYLHCTC